MIRPAEVDDIPWLLGEMKKFARFFDSKRSLFPEDETVAAGILEGLIKTQPFFVAENGIGPTGFIAGALAPHPYNPKIIVLNEMFWWVDKEHRGGTTGARLLKHFMNYGIENADWIVMTLEAGTPVDPEHFERAGFKEYERSYLLEVQNGSIA